METRLSGSGEDRRRKRSDDPLVALHHQLSHARTDGDFEAVVLADPSGVVVAGAGSWAVCEELAAYAPLFARDEPDLSGRVEVLRREVVVHAMHIDGQEVFLCVRGGRERRAVIARAAEGVTRILQAA
jgi:hypothetical protein